MNLAGRRQCRRVSRWLIGSSVALYIYGERGRTRSRKWVRRLPVRRVYTYVLDPAASKVVVEKFRRSVPY